MKLWASRDKHRAHWQWCHGAGMQQAGPWARWRAVCTFPAARPSVPVTVFSLLSVRLQPRRAWRRLRERRRRRSARAPVTARSAQRAAHSKRGLVSHVEVRLCFEPPRPAGRARSFARVRRHGGRRTRPAAQGCETHKKPTAPQPSLPFPFTPRAAHIPHTATHAFSTDLADLRLCALCDSCLCAPRIHGVRRTAHCVLCTSMHACALRRGVWGSAVYCVILTAHESVPRTLGQDAELPQFCSPAPVRCLRRGARGKPNAPRCPQITSPRRRCMHSLAWVCPRYQNLKSTEPVDDVDECGRLTP